MHRFTGLPKCGSHSFRVWTIMWWHALEMQLKINPRLGNTTLRNSSPNLNPFNASTSVAYKIALCTEKFKYITILDAILVETFYEILYVHHKNVWIYFSNNAFYLLWLINFCQSNFTGIFEQWTKFKAKTKLATFHWDFACLTIIFDARKIFFNLYKLI